MPNQPFPVGVAGDFPLSPGQNAPLHPPGSGGGWGQPIPAAAATFRAARAFLGGRGTDVGFPRCEVCRSGSLSESSQVMPKNDQVLILQAGHAPKAGGIPSQWPSRPSRPSAGQGSFESFFRDERFVSLGL